MPLFDQAGDELDDPGDRLAGEGLVVGSAQRERVGVRDVGGGHLACEAFAADTRGMSSGVDLVVDVRDVYYKRHRIALVHEEALEQRKHHEWPGISDMDPAVDSRPAGID